MSDARFAKLLAELGVDDGGIPFSEVMRPFLGVVHKYVLPSLDYLMCGERNFLKYDFLVNTSYSSLYYNTTTDRLNLLSCCSCS